MKETRFLSVCGMLGYGFPDESLERGMARQPDFIGVDAGSTDPGPYYLGAGKGFVDPVQVERDLERALVAARSAGIPLIVGNAGGSGARQHLDDFLKTLRSVAARRGLRFRMAVIPADVPKDTVADAIRDGRLRPCGPAPEINEADVRACSNLVAQMGVAPLMRALDAGAEVIVTGRCCDTAIFAAAPIREGFDPGLAFHAAKIAECGALCARPAGANDALIATLREDHFVVEPTNPQKQCFPDSVAAHSLYEQPDPHQFVEPEGIVDMSACRFEAVDDRCVRVSGSRLVPADPFTVKLEGAALAGYRAFTIGGVRDPALIGRLDEMEQSVRETVEGAMAGDVAPKDFTLRFIRYGLDGVMGKLEPPRATPPHEVGLLMEAVAPEQGLANRIVALARSTALHQHFEGRKTTAGNLAFPFSPSDFAAGPVYEFRVYHLMETDDEAALFPVEIEEVGA